MASWDDDDFDTAGDVPSVSNGLKVSDKWEGEDEEIAEAWDDEDDDKSEGTAATSTSTAATDANKKRRKNIKDIIKEKEEKRLEELARKKAAIEAAEANDKMTPEEILRAQEESDLLLAKETFGVADSPIPSIDHERSIDHQEPKDAAGFEKLFELLRDKLINYEKSSHYPLFLESMFRELSINQDADFLRKLSTMFAAMANEKVKLQKGKSKKKGANKGKIATIRENDFVNDANPEIDEFDDFI